MRELPAQCRTSEAVRLWRARDTDPKACEWYERMFADDGVVRHRMPDDTTDFWWIAGPIEKPKHPRETHSPDVGELVCDWCLPQAVHLYQQSWDEANL